MSVIVSPFPPIEGSIWTTPYTASWWRLNLRPSPDENQYLYEIAVDEAHTRLSWTFWDGEDAVIEPGYEIPRLFEALSMNAWTLDMLTIGRPTASPGWQSLTSPGHFRHPNDRPTVPIFDTPAIERLIRS